MLVRKRGIRYRDTGIIWETKITLSSLNVMAIAIDKVILNAVYFSEMPTCFPNFADLLTCRLILGLSVRRLLLGIQAGDRLPLNTCRCGKSGNYVSSYPNREPNKHPPRFTTPDQLGRSRNMEEKIECKRKTK